jgi:HPt (histidine-containing phosphotransfer) domain-containing protein
MFLANGFDDFISKPIDIRQLNLVLNKLIRDRYPLNTGNSTGLHRGGSGSYASGRSGLQATDRSGDQSADRSGSQTADRSGLQFAGGSAPLRSTQRLLHDIGGDQPGKPNDLSKILFEANPRFAEIFARDAQKSLDALEAVLKKGAPFEEEDMKTYLLHVHGMKGALANVGKMDLSAVALKLEQYARKEDTGSIITETPAFLSALRTFVKSIQ